MIIRRLLGALRLTTSGSSSQSRSQASLPPVLLLIRSDWPVGKIQINMAKQKQLSPEYQAWIDARKRHNLSHVHIQMARELGMNPKRFGKLDNHKQEPWKAPLPIFIESLYFKRFGKDRPENARSIEQMVKDKKRKQIERKQRKIKKSQQDAGEGPGNTVPF
jgi:hypothetical protein